jgi:hypothetical protein
MRHVELAVKAVEICPKKTVLLGAWPTTPEVSYGWIEGDEGLRAPPAVAPNFSGPTILGKAVTGPGTPAAQVDRMWWNTL